MSATAFRHAGSFVPGLPAPIPRFTGLPRLNFVGGHNDPVQVPIERLVDAATSVLQREGRRLAIYNLAQGPLGYEGLRDFVADKVGRHRGIGCTRDEVMITSGSGQGIDLVSRILLKPGDTVLMEELSYGGAIRRHKQLGADVIGVAVDEDGMRPEALTAVLQGLAAKGVKPAYIYTIPTIQNPTGSIMPLERRQQILAIARAHGVPIFEDECYADLIWAGGAPPALYALDPTQVIHIGSFSKSLAPALRLGYVIADWPVLSQLAACKSDGGTGALDQMVAAEYFSTFFDEHIASLTGALAGKLETMMTALEEQFGTSVEMMKPKGGIFLWLTLPPAVDVRKLVKPAAEAGLVFNPGPEWSCEGGAISSMRLCFALPSAADIREGVATLARICHEQTGIPAQSANIRR